MAKTRDTAQVVVNNKDQFTFNYAFSPDETQEMIYVNAIKPLVLKLIQGYNVTILAYGQTGSGKTHTMGTTFDGNHDSEDMGLIPRAINEIFECSESQAETHIFEVKVKKNTTGRIFILNQLLFRFLAHLSNSTKKSFTICCRPINVNKASSTFVKITQRRFSLRI